MRKLGLALVFLQVGCSGATFSGGSSDSKKDQAAAPNGEQVNAPGTQSGGEAVLRPGEQKALFMFGAQLVPSDFLFVFDNSISMDKSKVGGGSTTTPKVAMQNGFANLSAANWPKDSRIGVTTTMPGDISNLSRPHAKVSVYAGKSVFEAGFLSLMNKAAQEKYKAAEPNHGYKDDMCESGWFAPTAKNSQGKPCLQVAVQSPFMKVVLEAGLVVVKQLMKKNPTGFFRKNSNVNIVFVSDTEDPGNANVEDLEAYRPEYSELRDLVMQNSGALNLKLHGVIPDKGCRTDEGTPQERGGKIPYQAAIKESGGVYLDFCEGTGYRSDYKKVVESILEKAQPEPFFTLPAAASKIIQVRVNGAAFPAEKALLLADKRTLRVIGLNASQENSIEVVFAP